MNLSRGKCLLVGITAQFGGCQELQSVLEPHGPDARRIAELSWVLFGGGAAILALVVFLTGLAIFGSSRARTRLSGPGSVVIGGLVFPAVTLISVLAYGVWLTHAKSDVAAGADPVRIEVTGEQWWWRVSYVGVTGERIVTANEIRVPVGRPIDFTLRSADVIHSFWVPSLGGKVDMIPGRTTTLRVTADRTGIFRGQCAEFCGGPHGLMGFEVLAVPPDDFESWLLEQRADARMPRSPAARRGLELFLAAGCGGCHMVRGTAATGVIGPDLTHLRTRRHIGAASLPLTLANVALFIADGQHVKPGNRMPPFRTLGSEVPVAIAAYLVGEPMTP